MFFVNADENLQILKLVKADGACGSKTFKTDDEKISFNFIPTLKNVKGSIYNDNGEMIGTTNKIGNMNMFEYTGGCVTTNKTKNDGVYYDWWEIPCSCKMKVESTSSELHCRIDVSGNILKTPDRTSSMFSSNTYSFICNGIYEMKE